MMGRLRQAGEGGDDVFRLLYTSRVNPSYSAEILSAHIDVILRYSRYQNPIMGITGVLLTNRRMFSQVLEGPENLVKNLYGHIACDPRHRAVKIIDHSAGTSRFFAEWSMAFIEPDAEFSAARSLFPENDGQLDIIATSVFCAAARRFLLERTGA